MKKLTLTLGAMSAAIAATLAFSGAGLAQGYGPGPGPGAGPGCAADGTAGPGCGYGPGGGRAMGMGGGGRGYGAQLLTPEERTAHMNAMHSFKTLEECNAYMAEHQKLIAERAKEKGLPVPPQRGNMCERMKAHGFIS